MSSTPKEPNGTVPSNGSAEKRKKSRKGSYLTKWLDKTMHHIQESTPTSEAYDTYLNSSINWPMGSQFSPGYDPFKCNIYNGESMPLPIYYNHLVPPPYSEYRYMHDNKGIQVRRPRRRSENKVEEISSTPADSQNYLQQKNFSDSQDFTSLPPIVTSMGDTNSNSDAQGNGNAVNNGRRYSDPCVGLPDVARPANEVDSGSEDGSELSGSQVGTRLLSCLLDQISALKMTNERLNRELQETRAELDTMRHQHVFFPKGPSSMGAPNLNGNGGQYSPGFVTELVREIRDASRMREDSMYARLRAMLIERTDNGLSSTESKLMERTLEEIKSSLRASDADKRRMMDRIVKLEDELRLLRLGNNYEPNESRVNGNLEEGECSRLRRELGEARRAKHNAEEHALKLERLVTQLRSKFNGQLTNGPDSLPSETETDTRRRTNSTNNLTNMTNPITNMTNNLTNMTNPITNLTSNMTNMTNPITNMTSNLANMTNNLTNLTNTNPTVVFGPVTDL